MHFLSNLFSRIQIKSNREKCVLLAIVNDMKEIKFRLTNSHQKLQTPDCSQNSTLSSASTSVFRLELYTVMEDVHSTW